jgi:tetratricopeptide (TPR) repeat protein
MQYLDLDLLFARSQSGYQVRVLRSPAGDGQSVNFAVPFTDLELENFVLRVGRFRARTRRVEAAPVTAAKQVGGQLFNAVFAHGVGECLRRSLDRARAEQAILRIRFRLSDCPELGDLPWEFLYDQNDDWFLALSARTPIVRYVQLPDPPRAVHVTLPLRVLAIRSEPTDCPQLDLQAEWTQVVAALSELTDAGLIALTELAVPTLSELRRALLRDTFHGLHYMGHGQFDRQHGGALLFTDRRGHGVPVTGGDLGVILRDHDSLRLAVLNACEGGRTDPADPFAGVADTLVRRGIPAVVAMQFEVSDEAAIEFAPALYGALAAGRPVDAAVSEARKAIYTISPLEWATPVLYLRADDAQLFDISQRESQRPNGSDPAANSKATAARHVDEGDFLQGQHRFTEAEAAYRSALAFNPRLACAHAGLGDALYRLNRFQEAEAACRQAIGLDPTSARAHAALANALGRLRRFKEAETAYREAIRLDPTNATAHDRIDLALQGPDAEAACREVIRLNPTDATAHVRHGFVLSNLARYAEAEAAFREAIRLDPSLAWAHRELGLVLQNLKQYAEAEAAYREAIRLDPTDATAHQGIGLALFCLQRYADAEAACRKAIRLNPTDATAHGRHGISLRVLERYPEAEAAFREAIRLDPSLPGEHRELGLVLENLKQYAEAETAYREAIRLDPTDATAHSGLGSALSHLNRYAEAETAYREAIRLDPSLGAAHGRHGVVLFCLNRYAEAETAYREAIRLDPALAWAHDSQPASEYPGWFPSCQSRSRLWMIPEVTAAS